MGKQLVPRLGREQPRLAAHAHDDGAQGREQLVQLAQGRVQCGAVILQQDAQKLHLAAHEGFHVKGGRRRQPLQGRIRDLSFRADHHVDGQVGRAVKIRIDRIQIGAAAQARDLARHLEDRMGDLAGDHVHLVRMGRGDDQVGIARACLVQNVGMAGKARDALHVQGIRCAADQVGVVVDDGDVVPFARQMAGNLPADLTRAADDDLHGRSLAARSAASRHAYADGLRRATALRAGSPAPISPSAFHPRPASRQPRPVISACGAGRCVPCPRTARCG